MNAYELLPATLDGRRPCRDCSRSALTNFTTCLAHLMEATAVFAPAPERVVVQRLSRTSREGATGMYPPTSVAPSSDARAPRSVESPAPNPGVRFIRRERIPG